MGKLDLPHEKMIKFTLDHTHNKELVVKMLTYEDAYGKSEEAMKIYTSKLSHPHTLFPIYVIHKKVLTDFGFDTSDESVTNYRKIFSVFYKSPTEYDRDVINSVYYMKNNKCMFYKKPMPKVGDKITDCSILNLDGSSTTLFNALHSISNAEYYFMCSFSMS